MGHSFATFQDRQVHLHDADITLIAYLIMSEAKKIKLPAEVAANMESMFNWWRESLWNSGPGCLDLRLDDFLKTPEDLGAFRGLVEQAVVTVRSFGDVISGEDRQRILETDAPYGERATSKVIAVLEEFRSLLSE